MHYLKSINQLKKIKILKKELKQEPMTANEIIIK